MKSPLQEREDLYDDLSAINSITPMDENETIEIIDERWRLLEKIYKIEIIFIISDN